jgi:hypothetical protein
MAERRLWIMPFKDAQSFQISRRHFKIPDTSYVTLSYALRTHQYEGTAAQNIVPQAISHQWFVHPCCCWKLFSSITVCTACSKYSGQKQRECGQHQRTGFNSEITELCWIFCSQMDIFTWKLWKGAALTPHGWLWAQSADHPLLRSLYQCG